MGEQALDIVCGKKVKEDSAISVIEQVEKTFYFCSHECKKLFEESPRKYIAGIKPRTGYKSVRISVPGSASEKVLRALRAMDISTVMVNQIRQLRTESAGGFHSLFGKYGKAYVPLSVLEFVCPDEDVERVIAAVKSAAGNDLLKDGFLIMPAEVA